MDDPAVLADCLKRRTHFELCPISSRQTGSVPMDLPGAKHPARLMIAEGANFSINRDGSTIGLNTHGEDLDVVRSWGFGEDVLARAVSLG